MEYIIKTTAAAILAAVLSLVIRKNHPEFALLLGLTTAVLCMLGLTELIENLLGQIRKWNLGTTITSDFFVPLLKCLGISLVSQLGVGVCKDAGQSAAAVGLELCGTVTAAWCLLPLIDYLFTMIEDML